MTPEQFLNVARCISVSMMLIDSNGQILAANPVAGSELRHSVKDLVGKPIANFVDEPPEAVNAFLKRCSRTREPSPGRLAIKREGAASAHYLFEGYLVEPRHETQPAILILRFQPRAAARLSFALLNQKIGELTAEVARRKKLEDERSALLRSEKSARLAAEQASRAKDEFLAIVSHELRAPLNVFKGWVDLLTSGEVEASEHAEIFSILQRNCNHQVRLIEDLLDTSGVITGKLKLELTPTNISTIVESATEAIRGTAEAKNIDLFISSSQTAFFVSGDSDRLRQVVWNLLTNAVKFTPQEGRVFVSLRSTHDKIEIKVTDEGEGIDPEFLPFVFERFRQENGSKTRPHGGLGLGLAIVRHIAELHGGTVAASSAGKGKGASFTIALPLLATSIGTKLTEKALSEKVPIESAKTGLCQDRPLEKLRILVVDDEFEARILMSRILQRQGAEVITAGSVKDALACFSANKFDLVVSDIGMPEETGLDLIRKIRLLDVELGRETPAAAVTGFAGGRDRELALAAGFHEHLTKPVEMQKLINVAVLLGKKLK